MIQVLVAAIGSLARRGFDPAGVFDARRVTSDLALVVLVLAGLTIGWLGGRKRRGE